MKDQRDRSLKLTQIDITAIFLVLGIVFVMFLHGDIALTGWSSSFYFKGDFLSFYETCKKYVFATSPYPPSIYLIFAVFSAPLEFLGFFNPYHPRLEDLLLLGFWLKILTTIVYVLSAWAFFAIAKLYVAREKAVFLTWLYLLFPLAIFVQFIFSQHDIFYVALAVCGVLFFLKRKIYCASCLFAIAITFKYFPIFTFIPLLLYFEKRITHIFMNMCICMAPLFLFNVLYAGSPAYIEMVRNFSALSRVFDARLGISVGVSLFVASYVILCVWCFFKEFKEECYKNDVIIIYLLSAALPFLNILFHPQWILSTVPPLVLSYLLVKDTEKLVLLDLAGMFCFVIVMAMIFPDNVDGNMFRLEFFGQTNSNIHTTGDIFSVLKEHSVVAFYSAFWAYLAVRVALPMFHKGLPDVTVDYTKVRTIFYAGILIFLLPTGLSVYKSANFEVLKIKVGTGNPWELVKGRAFEQVFVPQSSGEIQSIEIHLATFNRVNTSHLSIQFMDDAGHVLASIMENAKNIQDNSWYEVKFAEKIRVEKGKTYKLRLSSPDAAHGNGITWWTFKRNLRTKNKSFVDNAAVEDTQFCIVLVKSRE